MSDSEQGALARAGYTRTMDITEALMGPHEWGYRDPVEGGFVADGTPFAAAELITHLRAECARAKADAELCAAEWTKEIEHSNALRAELSSPNPLAVVEG